MGDNNSSNLHEAAGGGGGGGSGGGSMGRRALGDVTNQMENRGFKLVSRSPASKSLSGNKRSAENKDEDSEFWRQVSLVVDKLEKEKSGVVAKCPKIGSGDVGLSPLKGGKTYRLQTNSGEVGGSGSRMGSRNVGVEMKGSGCSSALDCIDLGETRDSVDVVSVDDEVQEGGCCEKVCVEIGKECQGEEIRGLSDVGECDFSPDALAEQVASDNGKSVAVDCTASSKCDSVVSSRLVDSEETRSFGLQRCSLLKGDAADHSDAGVKLLKNCSCSFCAKAAYIWSDLQCQDVKGRISTLAKSQKEASNFIKRYSVEDMMGEAQGHSSGPAKLESDLTGLWKSLFVHMENVLTAESSQLQTNFAALKELREDCKINLEMINGMPPDTQQCSSDASEF